MNQDNRYYQSSLGKSGMVASAHPLASLAGIDILRKGGNAMDACIAMAGVTAVVLPQMCGLGGDAFLVYYDAKRKTAIALNGSGVAGDAATPEHIRKMHTDEGFPTPRILPQDGILSVAVPGAPSVYEKALRFLGTLSMKEALEPAIEIAERGFPVTPVLAAAIRNSRQKLEKHRTAADMFFPGGRTLSPGEMLVTPDLAKTLRAFSEGGAEYFYLGPFADEFNKLSDELHGAFSGREMARHLDLLEDFYAPLTTDYRGYTICQTRPVSQGFLLLEEMNLLERFDIPSMDPLGPERVHIMVEAKKIAFDDRNNHAGDPKVTGFDVSSFISKEYADRACQSINLKAVCNTALRYPEPDGDTTSFVAVDEQGNACSFIHSVAFSFGSGLVVPGTGVILNNRAGRSFALGEDHPNCLAPCKRPMHTLNSYLVLAGDELLVAGGTPGGDGQPQWNMQILSAIIDHNASPQEACDFPRWLSFPGTDVINAGQPPEIQIESRYPEKTLDALRSMGHRLRVLGPWEGGGGAQLIMRDLEHGLLVGGSDRRVEGLALGF